MLYSIDHACFFHFKHMNPSNLSTKNNLWIPDPSGSLNKFHARIHDPGGSLDKTLGSDLWSLMIPDPNHWDQILDPDPGINPHVWWAVCNFISQRHISIFSSSIIYIVPKVTCYRWSTHAQWAIGIYDQSCPVQCFNHPFTDDAMPVNPQRRCGTM